jgi:hypothetical protein
MKFIFDRQVEIKAAKIFGCLCLASLLICILYNASEAYRIYSANKKVDLSVLDTAVSNKPKIDLSKDGFVPDKVIDKDSYVPPNSFVPDKSPSDKAAKPNDLVNLPIGKKQKTDSNWVPPSDAVETLLPPPPINPYDNDSWKVMLLFDFVCLLIIYPCRWLYYIIAHIFRLKYGALIIGSLFILLNPSESSFTHYAKAHDLGHNTAREYNFIVCSVFYTDGKYYLGILGTYIHI